MRQSSASTEASSKGVEVEPNSGWEGSEQNVVARKHSHPKLNSRGRKKRKKKRTTHLNRTRMNPIIMQHLPDLPNSLHILPLALLEEDMNGGDDLVLGELPAVELVNGDDTRDVEDRGAEVFEVDGGGDGLEENERGGFDEREGGREDDDGDDEGD
jgi:hypothetical protein